MSNFKFEAKILCDQECCSPEFMKINCSHSGNYGDVRKISRRRSVVMLRGRKDRFSEKREESNPCQTLTLETRFSLDNGNQTMKICFVVYNYL